MNYFYAKNGYYIPNRMERHITEYIEKGLEPGSFLTAVICNNLKETFGQADDENLRNIFAYVHYFYNKVPIAAWGSPQRMRDWMQHKGKSGLKD